MTTLALACGWMAALVLGGLAFLFWRDPEDGMRQATHLPENLPLVMANRYGAFAFLAVAFTLYGDLAVLAIFLLACAFMGFTDGRLYARQGKPHIKHTLSGVLSLIALCVTLAGLAGNP